MSHTGICERPGEVQLWLEHRIQTSYRVYLRQGRCIARCMVNYGWLRWYIKIIQRLAAFTHLPPTLQPRLWPEEVKFGLAASTTPKHHIVLAPSRSVHCSMYGPLWVVTVVYIKLIQRLAAFTHLPPTLQPRLWSDEVQFGLAASTASNHI